MHSQKHPNELCENLPSGCHSHDWLKFLLIVGCHQQKMPYEIKGIATYSILQNFIEVNNELYDNLE